MAKKNYKQVRVVKPDIKKIVDDKTEKVEYPAFTKFELKPVELQANHVRCIVLKDYNGMTDELRTGDIIDLPERRYKSLSFRGLVEKYDGKKSPNKLR